MASIKYKSAGWRSTGILLSLMLALQVSTVIAAAAIVTDGKDEITVKADHYTVKIIKQGFRYSVSEGGKEVLTAHPDAGMIYLNSPVTTTRLLDKTSDSVSIEVENRLNVKAKVSLKLYAYSFKISAVLNDPDMQSAILLQTGGVGPSYGLADHAAFRSDPSTEVSGYKSKYFGATTDNNPTRLVSNFVISPANGIAFVNMEPSKKIINVSEKEWGQGSVYVNKLKALYYFTGTTQQIYQDYLAARNREGYLVYKPKYEWFGVGWEAFGALGWTTNQNTIKENIDTYLKLGFPLSWMVLGSGFWPNQEDRLQTTTSFGAWDNGKYPEPARFVHYYKDKGLKFMLGLRIDFIPNGLFTNEGLQHGYFIKKEGKARLFKLGFPKVDCYLLDGNNPTAVKWYSDLCKKWLNYGVDGFKEDLFGYETADFNDDKLEAVNRALMNDGVYVMGRNGYLGSPADLHRFEDFNYNQNQDRGPVNGLAFSYSGFPYTYPDIIGGTGLANRQFGGIEKDKLSIYLMRYARYASVNPSMAFGYGVWQLNNEQVLKVSLDAAKLHAALQPYIYDAALKTWQSGFPYTLTPLPLAYTDEKDTYLRENNHIRGYEWMLGESLLAYPLYGDDYMTASTRNVYLPKGNWVDYDNGKMYKGPLMLNDFEIPVDKTPLFVGGKGFVTEQTQDKLYARIYPVGYAGKISFNYKDGRQSVINIKKAVNSKPRVKDLTTGKMIAAEKVRYAWQFEMLPAHQYEIN